MAPQDRRQHAESPFTVHAESKLLKFKARKTQKPAPWARDSLLVRIGCSVRVSSESHHLTGSPARSVPRQRYEYAPDSDDEVVIVELHAEDLRSEPACHAAFRRRLRRLPQLAGFRGAEAALWDAFVPPGVVGEILLAAAAAVSAAAAGGEEGGDLRSVGYYCDVWMHMEAATVYSEAKALLMSCADGVVVGGEEQCPICLEEMTADDGDGDATSLPGCSHAFHRACILEWLHTAPTCPCCRGEMMQYLPHQYCQGDEA